MNPILSAHLEFMAQARALGVLRTVHGHAYPLPVGELQRWQAEQAELRRKKARAFLQSRMAARSIAERAFAD